MLPIARVGKNQCFDQWCRRQWNYGKSMFQQKKGRTQKVKNNTSRKRNKQSEVLMQQEAPNNINNYVFWNSKINSWEKSTLLCPTLFTLCCEKKKLPCWRMDPKEADEWITPGDVEFRVRSNHFLEKLKINSYLFNRFF